MRHAIQAAAAAAAVLLAAGAASAQTVTSFATGLGSLRGVAVDSANNVLVNDLSGATRLIPAGGGASTVYATSANPNEGVTVAASGDVYTSGSDIYRFTAANVGGVFVSAPPYSLGMDFTSAGLMYVIVGTEVHTVTSGGTRTPLVTSGLTQPYGIAISASDVVVVSDQTQNKVYRVNGDGSLTLYADFASLGTPVGLVFRGPELYVVTRETNVYRVDSLGATPTLFASLGGSTTFDIAVQPDGAALYASHDSGEVDRISLPALVPTVPTLSEWAMGLLAALLAMAGALYVQRRPGAA